MKIPIGDIQIIYSGIINEINVGEISIVMFTSLDVDALCTLKILSKFMKTENIEYKIYPVSTYTQLEQKIQDCKSFEKVRLYFFINCGGLIDLSSKWFSKNSKIFLFDVHKPIHHNNIEAENVKLVDDLFSGFEQAPSAYQMEVYQNMDEQFMEDLEDYDDKGEQSDDQDIMGHRRRRIRTAAQQQQRMEKIKKIRSQITQKVQGYYSHQFFGLPSSYIAHRFIKDLNKNNNEYLWYGMVGVTGSYLQQKTTKQNFENLCELYRSDMSKFNTVTVGKQNIDKNTLKRKLDFQFPVYKHWTLYDSIMNSPYMISKLTLWDQVGISKLYQFLNRIGLSLNQSRQLYKFLLKDSVRKLEENIFQIAPMENFNLLDITFDSFAKQVDYCMEFMASDYYYALTAALEAPMKKKMTSIEELLNHRVDCFWNAYLLFDANQSALKASIQEYKKMLEILTRQAKGIVEKNHIMNGQLFSFVNLLNDTSDRQFLEHPFTLIKLANMLMLMNRQKRKQRYFKPFILSLQNNQTNTSLIVGVMGDAKNSFSSKFNYVVQKLNIDVRIDSFMGNIMIVPKQAMVKVIRELGQL